MSSSPNPSSSAVTIPTPGKSILKRPPPPQQSFFSLGRLSKLLPSQNSNASNDTNDDNKPLKRAHFILPELTTVYPIHAANPPSTPTLKEEKRSIEEHEAERRKRVVRRNSVSPESAAPEQQWWSLEQVEFFYRECCVGREESPDPGITAAFLRARGVHPRTVDFSGVQLTVGSASVLSDVFTIEWGLRKLVFKECNLDEYVLKPMLHSLLIPESLTFLSVASNRRMKASAFRLIGAYVSKAKSLQFLDLSQNSIDKKSIEYLAAALPEVPALGLVSLRLDDCSLKPQALDVLAHSVRVSSLKNISLRHNRIGATGAVALALMIRDYPDRYPTNGSASPSPITSPASSTFFSPPPTPSMTKSPLSPLPADNPPSPAPRLGPVLPPPRHPTTTGPQTTYTPYIPRAKRAAAALVAAQPNTNPLSSTGQQIPIITSSAQGGITTRHSVPPSSHSSNHNGGHHDHRPSAALLDKVRALDTLPRLGALRTLDLRGNDIRTGITYIAQVLKRNRTLKVLNLCENKLDVQGLVAIAEALKYNSCLETLDMSKNPCCGPSLEGVQSLRTAFTLNTALKRLFLASTSMTSTGAIALAEFLPESTSLLHLDLTMNNLDLAGVMALNSGLKANHIMRCIDLNIPPGDEELARMCREILNTCVRNTEEAEKATQSHPDVGQLTSGRGHAKGVWLMIEESELAKTFRKDSERKKVEDFVTVSSPNQARDRTNLILPPMEQKENGIIQQAQSCKSELERLFESSSSLHLSTSTVEIDPELSKRSREALNDLAQLIDASEDPMQLEELLCLNDDITSLLAKAGSKRPSPRIEGLGIDLRDLTETPHTNGHSSDEEAATEDDEPLTPRMDKGKGRAEPEPEKPEPILSPVVPPEVHALDEEEDPEAKSNLDDIISPTDRSRSWVAEEGEVFRKGAVLLTPEEMENEYDSEELRKELLEAMVERPPPRTLMDTFSDVPTDAPPSPGEPAETVNAKPAPLPYIRRTRSSSSQPSTPTLEHQESPFSPAAVQRSASTDVA